MRRILATGLVLLCVGGCSFARDQTSSVNTCKGDGDCGPQAHCDGDLGFCISEDHVPYPFLLRVQSPSSPTALPTVASRFGPFKAADFPKTLKVRQPRVLRGAVALVPSGHGEPEPLTVDLLITPAAASEGPPADTLTVSTAATFTALDSGQSANFAVSLRDGVSYAVSVQPFGDAVALVPPRQLMLTAKVVRSGFIEITYDDLHELQGQIRTADGAPLMGTAEDGSMKPLRLSVRVVDATSFEPLSSRAVTDHTGAFTVRTDGPLPSLKNIAFEFGPTVAPDSASTSSSMGNVEDMLTLAAPDFGTLRIPAAGVERTGDAYLVTLPSQDDWVEVRGRAERPAPTYDGVAGASLTFTTETLNVPLPGDAAATATYLQTVVADDNGVFRANLWPGTYDVVAIPPSDVTSLAPVTRSAFEVFPQAGGLQSGVAFTFADRAVFTGTVLDDVDAPLSGMTVQAAPVSVPDLPAVADQARGDSATTDMDGNYRLPVDVGLFDFVLEPPESSHYAWEVVPDRLVAADTEGGTLNIRVPSPVVIQGVVEYESGRSPVGATLTAFTRLDSQRSGKRYVQIGRTTLDEQGAFLLLLSPSQL